IAEAEPSPGSDAVGLVVELLRPQIMKLPEQSAGEQIRMQLSDAIDREATDNGKMGHPQHRLTTLLDQRQVAATASVSGPAGLDLVQEAGVDLVNDLQDARQQFPEQTQRPAFQR